MQNILSTFAKGPYLLSFAVLGCQTATWQPATSSDYASSLAQVHLGHPDRAVSEFHPFEQGGFIATLERQWFVQLLDLKNLIREKGLAERLPASNIWHRSPWLRRSKRRTFLQELN